MQIGRKAYKTTNEKTTVIRPHVRKMIYAISIIQRMY